MNDNLHVFTYADAFGYTMTFAARDEDDARAYCRDTELLDMDGATIERIPDNKALRIGIGEPGEFRRGDPETEGASFDEDGRPYLERTAWEWAASIVDLDHRIIAESPA